MRIPRDDHGNVGEEGSRLVSRSGSLALAVTLHSSLLQRYYNRALLGILTVRTNTSNRRMTTVITLLKSPHYFVKWASLASKYYRERIPYYFRAEPQSLCRKWSIEELTLLFRLAL